MILPQRLLRAIPLLIVVTASGLTVLRAGDQLVSLIVTPQAQPYEERHRATYHLGKNLVREDVSELVAFLERNREQDSVRESELRSLKNNVADALVAQNKPEPALLDDFLRLAADPGQDSSWREYLLQKLPDLALRFDAAEVRGRAIEFLRGRAESTEYIFAGTALLALQRLGAGDPSLIGPVEIARRAQAILDHPQQANACKIAALQVLGSVDESEGRRRALGVLADEQSPIMLRVSALATLGEHGQGEDLPRINRYQDSPDYRLRTAARAAIKKLGRLK